MKQGGTAVYPSLAVIAEDVFILEKRYYCGYTKTMAHDDGN
ncbi:MAG: hypothetical protein V8R05_00270 [Dialister invisus]